MWVYVVYGARSDSTAQAARSIARAVSWSNEDEARPAAVVNPEEIRTPALVFLGCAAGGSELDRTIRRFLDRLPRSTWYGTSFAVFDTRPDAVPRVAGSGVRRLRRAVVHRGGRLVAPGQSFFAPPNNGGVAEDELDRARAWAATVIALGARFFRAQEVRSGVLSAPTVRPTWFSPWGTTTARTTAAAH